MFAIADEYESIGITLCLIPIIQSDLLDNIIKQDVGVEGEFPLVGGIRGTNHRGILPTGETWVYFCCKNEIEKRIALLQSIPDYLIHPEALLHIEPAIKGEPLLSGRLILSNYFKQQFKHESFLFEQRISNLALGGFIYSNLKLDDLILPQQVIDGIEEIKHWQHFQQQPADHVAFSKRIKQGLKILFFGITSAERGNTTFFVC